MMDPKAFATGVAVGVGAMCVGLAVKSRWPRRGDDDDDDDDESSDDESSDDEDDESGARQAELPPVRDDYDEADAPYKMLLIFNMELYKMSSKTGELKAVKMSAGKAAAQSGHATLGAYRRARRYSPKALASWLRIGQMKITLKCPTVAELHDLERNCAAAGLNTKLIRDAGHTEIEPGSRTVLAVGPAPASALDPITRHLKPY